MNKNFTDIKINNCYNSFKETGNNMYVKITHIKDNYITYIWLNNSIQILEHLNFKRKLDDFASIFEYSEKLTNEEMIKNIIE